MTSPALQAALDRITREFGNPNGRLVRMARTMLRVGAEHAAARARYGTFAQELADKRLDLDGALIVVARALARERDLHDRSARLHGHSLRPRMMRDALHEMLMLGRWLRRHQPCRLPEILGALTTPAWSRLPDYARFTPSHPVTIQAAE